MKLLNSKAGVTVLEGIIALGLLAVVTAGAFGVLLSAARKSTQPDMREEMVLAVEKAKDALQVYIDTAAAGHLPDKLKSGLCNNGDSNPLGAGEHNIHCMLPRLCDTSLYSPSEFKYVVSSTGYNATQDLGKHQEGGTDREAKLCDNCPTYAPTNKALFKITFTIKCNGYEL